MKITWSQILRILLYNAIFSGVGLYLIGNYFGSSYNSLILLLVLAALVVFDSIIDRRSLGVYGIKKPKRSDVKYAVAIFALFFPIAIASRILFPAFDAVYASTLNLNGFNYIQFLIFVVPLGILTEEMGTRALFQSKMAPLFGDRLAIYSVIANFTLLHFSWAFALDLTNFLIVILTVLAYSALLAFLFYYTKNILSTIIVHLLTNVVSTYQLIYHITGQFFNEAILWAAWGVMLILFYPIATEMLRKAYSSAKLINFKGLQISATIIFVSLFSLIVITLLRYYG